MDWIKNLFSSSQEVNVYHPDAFDITVIIIALVMVLLSFFFLFRYLFFPGEEEKDHIKRKILNHRDDG
ncbi:MAG: hypothetical protein GX103_00785 [Bacteroidales bacterium]|jgi:hypothetical protein|nr:hypothetical protein [Bacteroidales bacterium]